MVVLSTTGRAKVYAYRSYEKTRRSDCANRERDESLRLLQNKVRLFDQSIQAQYQHLSFHQLQMLEMNK
jgi:hypothetical protein